ncbi:uncharacterized protein LOC128199835 [Bicyclus anynana]|uniref:Uncharacterized protein LOC128199835 n=1 Tax=Bicyclus anynana TaxID=110368 RepID=A0ABM3M7P5_BICAN|nr:uncharacterized protein LOC128199835 [Bicyclus anynana]
MFAPCLLLFILGTINADEAPLHCDFDHTLCGWWNDENAGAEWTNHLNVKGIFANIVHGRNMARLISPIYDHGLVEDGCLYLDCGFYISDIAFRVYQVPVSLGVTGLFTSTEEIKRKYIIHEAERVNVTSISTVYLYPVSMFHPGYTENFQIVIEASCEKGIVFINEAEIFRGRKCIEAANASVTPPPGTTQVYFENRNNNLQTVTTSPNTTTT